MRTSVAGALLLLALAAGARAQNTTADAPSSASQCAYDGSAQKCDVSPAFIISNVTAPAPGQNLSLSLLRSLAADALCSLMASDADCGAQTNANCSWNPDSSPSCRLATGTLLGAAQAAAACPGSLAAQQLPCTPATDNDTCANAGNCTWVAAPSAAAPSAYSDTNSTANATDTGLAAAAGGPSTAATQLSPADGTSSGGAATGDATQQAPSSDTSQQAPTSDATQQAPTSDTTQQAPAGDATQQAPTSDTSQQAPAGYGFPTTDVGGAGADTGAAQPASAGPAAGGGATAPVYDTTQQAPASGTAQAAPSSGTAQQAPASGTAQPASTPAADPGAAQPAASPLRLRRLLQDPSAASPAPADASASAAPGDASTTLTDAGAQGDTPAAPGDGTDSTGDGSSDSGDVSSSGTDPTLVDTSAAASSDSSAATPSDGSSGAAGSGGGGFLPAAPASSGSGYLPTASVGVCLAADLAALDTTQRSDLLDKYQRYDQEVWGNCTNAFEVLPSIAPPAPYAALLSALGGDSTGSAAQECQNNVAIGDCLNAGQSITLSPANLVAIINGDYSSLGAAPGTSTADNTTGPNILAPSSTGSAQSAAGGRAGAAASAVVLAAALAALLL